MPAAGTEKSHSGKMDAQGLNRLRKNTFIFFPTFREAFFFCGAAVFQR
jgi:hypothetical protein